MRHTYKRIVLMLLIAVLSCSYVFPVLAVRAAPVAPEGPVPPLSEEIVLNGKWTVKTQEVYLEWEIAKDGVTPAKYNIYMDNAESPLNSEPMTECSYTYHPEESELDKVHTFVVKALDDKQTKVLTSNEKKLGFVLLVDSFNPAASVKIPVSDLAQNLEYMGPLVSDARYDFWCSSVIKVDGKYHLFAARWDTRMTFYPAWHCVSEVAHYESDFIDGPYKELGVVFSTEILNNGLSAPHNVQVYKCDGKYVLSFTTQDKGESGPITDNAYHQQCMMATADSIYGPWKLEGKNGVVVSDPGMAAGDDFIAVNPAFIKENGEYRIYYKRSPYGPEAPKSVTYMLATSENLTGPYVKEGQVLSNAGVVEDATIYHEQDQLLMVVQDFMKNNTGAGYGAVWHSNDGRSFPKENGQVAFGTLNNHAKLPTGWDYTDRTSHQMERPCVVYDESGTPTHMIIACRTSVDGIGNSHAYLFKINRVQHDVSIDPTIAGGAVRVDQDAAYQYENIYVTVEPEAGKHLKPGSLKIQYQDLLGKGSVQKEKPLYLENKDTASFVLPASDCVVTAEFEDGASGTVDRVQIYPQSADLQPGESMQFRALVDSEGNVDSGVIWSLQDNQSIRTSVDQKGKVTIEPFEQSRNITVIARSKENGQVVGTAAITVQQPEERMNLALNKESTASTSFTNGNNIVTKPEYITDGTRTFQDYNIWTPDRRDSSYWVQIDLGSSQTFNALSLFDTGAHNGGAYVTGCTVQTSADAQTWETQAFRFADAQAAEKPMRLSKPVNAQYVKLSNFTLNKKGGPHVLEVEVYNENIQEGIDGITVTPQTEEAVKGSTVQFKAEVQGMIRPGSNVAWSLEGEYQSDTTIDQTGKLTIANQETAPFVVVSVSVGEESEVSESAIVWISTSPENLAQGKTVESSTAFLNAEGAANPTYVAAKAVDGNMKTRWVGAAKGTGTEHLIVDLSSNTEFSRVILCEQDYPRVKIARIYTSDTKADDSWVLQKEVSFDPTTDEKVVDLDNSCMSRYVKCEMIMQPDSSTGAVGANINEIEIYHIERSKLDGAFVSSKSPRVGTILEGIVFPADAQVSYKWIVDGETRGTQRFYMVQNADLGKAIQLTASIEGIEKSDVTEAVRAGNSQEKSPTELAIAEKPAKLLYTEGEYFVTDGLEMKVRYSDGSEEITENYSVVPNRPLKRSDTSVTFAAQGMNVQLEIRVVPKGSECVHEVEKTWQHDETHHWKNCKFCGIKMELAEHVWQKDESSSTPTAIKYVCVCGTDKTEEIGGGGSSATRYAITTSAGEGGKISPTSASVEKGKSQSFTITPSEGYVIKDVLADGKSVGAVSNYTFANVTANHTLSVVFEKSDGQQNYTDVSDSDWFAPSVKWAVENKLMNGTGENKFSPAAETTRAMTLTMLYRQAGSPNATGTGNWYDDAANWAKENKISDGSDLSGSITREQLVTMLWRASGSPKLMDYPGLNAFQDAGEISDWAQQAMAWAHQKGIITGKGQNNLDPTGTATRAETAAMFMRLAQK